MGFKGGTAALLAASLTIGIVGLSHADQNLNCEAYATKAVQQQKTNLSLVCGLSGGAWGDDYSGHWNWCRQPDVRIADVTREDSNRDEALDVCRQRAAVCDEYAALAREQYLISAALGCGFSGPRWSTDTKGHRNWCMSQIVNMGVRVVGPGDPIYETGQRDDALAACRQRANLVASGFQDADQRMQQYLNMLSKVMKALKEAGTATIRNMQ